MDLEKSFKVVSQVVFGYAILFRIKKLGFFDCQPIEFNQLFA